MLSILLAACGAATEVQSADGPTSLGLFEPTTTSASAELEPSSTTLKVSTTAAVDEVTTSTESPSSSTAAPTTTDQPTTTESPSTTVAVDVNAPFCAAASSIVDLGTSVSLDDTEAAAVFFDQQAERWAAAVPVAPFVIAPDVVAVATFVDELRNLMVENDYDLFAVFDEAAALEAQLGSDEARIRSDQFIYRTCDIEPEAAVDATAVFYIELLETADGQEQLAEILAAAEVFPLDGARCFVGRTSVDAVYPLVGATSTTAQAAALDEVLGVCQLTMGSTT